MTFGPIRMDIHIEIIPHDQQRYPTVGDWWIDANGVTQVRASQMSDLRRSALIVIHELNEILIESVKWTGMLAVPPSLVEETDEFDKTYEANRARDNKEGEPGLDPHCPVYQGHMAASAIEMIAAMILGVNYNDYADEVANL